MEDVTPRIITKPIGSTAQSKVAAPSAVSKPWVRMGLGPTLREQGGEALALAGVAHDARSLVTAMGLCAQLISEPGVLTPAHGHLAAQMRSIAESSAQLVRRLTELTRKTAQAQTTAAPAETPVRDLSQSVQKLRSLLAAIAGPATEVEFACLPCAGLLRLSEESLSRILVNLVRNAVDAMPTGGRIRITTQRGNGASFLWTLNGETETGPETDYLWDDLPHPAGTAGSTVVLSVEDSGPGIPTEFIQRVFDAGFTTRESGTSWPKSQHHGLGLSIVHDLVEAAGGTVRAVSSPRHGARIEIELQLTNVTPNLLLERRQDALGSGQ